jgi:hypothetical protein
MPCSPISAICRVSPDYSRSYAGFRPKGIATPEDVRREEERAQREHQPRLAAFNLALARGGRRAFSLGGEIRDAFMRVDDLAGRLHRAMLGQNAEDQAALWREIMEAGGALQSALRQNVLASAAEPLGPEETSPAVRSLTRG